MANTTAYLAIGGVLVILSVLVVVAVLVVIFIKYEKKKTDEKPTPTSSASGGGGGNTPNPPGNSGYWIAGSSAGRVFVYINNQWNPINVSLGSSVIGIVSLPGETSFLVLLMGRFSGDGVATFKNCLYLVDSNLNRTPIDLSVELSPENSDQDYFCGIVSDGRNVQAVTSYGNVIYKPISEILAGKTSGWKKPLSPLRPEAIWYLAGGFNQNGLLGQKTPCVAASFGRKDSNSSCMFFSTSSGVPNTFPGSFICSSDGKSWNPAGFVTENVENQEKVTGCVYAKDSFIVCTSRSDIFQSTPKILESSSAFKTLSKSSSPVPTTNSWKNIFGGDLGGEIPFRGIAYNNTSDDTFVAIYKNASSRKKAGGPNNGALVFRNSSTPTQVRILEDSLSPLAVVASDGKIFATISEQEGFFYFSDESSNHTKWIQASDVPISIKSETITVLKHSSNI